MRFQCGFEASGDMRCAAGPEMLSRSDASDGGMRVGLALRSKKVCLWL